ncbi:MAG: hypothetical protein R3A52_05920 [Polyangiales bacterium]
MSTTLAAPALRVSPSRPRAHTLVDLRPRLALVAALALGCAHARRVTPRPAPVVATVTTPSPPPAPAEAPPTETPAPEEPTPPEVAAIAATRVALRDFDYTGDGDIPVDRQRLFARMRAQTRAWVERVMGEAARWEFVATSEGVTDRLRGPLERVDAGPLPLFDTEGAGDDGATGASCDSRLSKGTPRPPRVCGSSSACA